MFTFNLITNTRNALLNELFQRACARQRIVFNELNLDKPFPLRPKFGSHDLVYRAVVTQAAKSYERSALTPQTTTLYRHFDETGLPIPLTLTAIDQALLLERHNIPAPRTVFAVQKTVAATRSDKILLRRQLNKSLGEPPYIIKLNGSFMGIGTLKADSFSSLVSIIDYLRDRKIDFMIREYIPVTKSARLVVLGDQVVASLEFKAPLHDFRSNAKGAVAKSKTFSKKITEMAVSATRALGFEFGGVDILWHNKTPFVAEVNFPCVFVTAARKTEVDIASLLIKHLIAKHKQTQSHT